MGVDPAVPPIVVSTFIPCKKFCSKVCPVATADPDGAKCTSKIKLVSLNGFDHPANTPVA